MLSARVLRRALLICVMHTMPGCLCTPELDVYLKCIYFCRLEVDGARGLDVTAMDHPNMMLCKKD